MSVEVITEPETRTARKARRCTWCGQMVNPGEKYVHQRVKVDGDMSTNDMHPECDGALNALVDYEGGEVTYNLYGEERPTPPQPEKHADQA
jgi:hypothetical protein